MTSSKHSGKTVRDRLKPSTPVSSLHSTSWDAIWSAEPIHGA